MRHRGVAHARTGRSRVLGVSLIEVLVSIVIASMGLLALAGVNASSVRYTKLSQYRGTATQLASDLGERMRANKQGLAAYDYAATDFAGQAAAAPAPAATLCDSYAQTCTPAQLAAYDLAQWRMLVRDQLPTGSVFIKVDTAKSAADLWVVWRDPAVANTDEQAVAAGECASQLNAGATPEVRCSFFRINL